MADADRKISSEIENITIPEAKKITKMVREIDNTNPDRSILILIHSLEDKSVKEVRRVLREIFPSKKTAR